MLAPFAPANELPCPWADGHVVKFKTYNLRGSEPSEQHDADDGSSFSVLSKFNFPQNLANLRCRQSLWQNRHPPQLFDRLGWIVRQGTRLHQVTQKATDRDQGGKSMLAASWQALLAIGILGLLCTGLASILFFHLVNRTGAGFVSLLNYLVPLWAVAIGVLMLGESIPLSAWGALLLVLAGLVLIQRAPDAPHHDAARPEGGSPGVTRSPEQR